jgi:hypothetical protein
MKSLIALAHFVEGLPAKNKVGTLRIWGQWFGRPMDNVHECISCRVGSDSIILTFNEGETLTIWNPGDVTVQNSTILTFSSATRVRWEWHYYGRPKDPTNRMFIEYLNESGMLLRKSNCNYAAADTASLGKPAVQLCSS